MSTYRYLTAATLAAATLLGAGAASAEDGDNAFELALGPAYTSRDDFSLGVVGLRWSHSFNPRWGFEIAGSTDDVDDLDRSQRFLDLSARYTFFNENDWELFAFWGGGVLTYRSIFIGLNPNGFPIVVDNGDDETATAHAGLGARWSFNDRLYLRPELRYRDHLDVFTNADNDSFEATVALGWRF